ncbi:hypothetical protein JL36_02545 [Lactococcus cremoris]|nr:hypothetical protein JL36_02545 [Lactococcus cremoris]
MPAAADRRRPSGAPGGFGSAVGRLVSGRGFFFLLKKFYSFFISCLFCHKKYYIKRGLQDHYEGAKE